VIAFSAMFLISRISIIEGDLVPTEVGFYQKIDSFYYAGLAFEWFEGKYEPDILRNGITALPAGLFINICVYLSLITFGDNFFGFRLSVVFVALATSLIFAWLTTTRFGLMGLVLSLAFFLFSFPWFLASIAVEPTIYRLFFTSILILAIIMTSEKHRRAWPSSAFFFVSLLAYAGVVLVYVTNLFAVAALIGYQVWRCLIIGSWSEFGRFLGWHLLALIAAVLVWIGISEWVFGGVGLVLNMLTSVSERAAITDVSLLEGISENYFAMKEFPLFISIPGLFPAYLLSLAVMAWSVTSQSIRTVFIGSGGSHQEPDEVIAVFSMFSLAFFFQTLFVNDYPARKMVAALPFVVFGWLLIMLLATKSKLIRGIFSMALIGALAVSNGPIIYRQLYANYSEKMKNAMVSLQSLGDAEVIGGFGHAFRLYNDIRPYLNTYAYVYGHRDLETYNKAMSGRIKGVEPQYSVQILVSEEIVKIMAARGFVYERELLAGTEGGIGNVALFRWVGDTFDPGFVPH
jgi:hypothetical protein